MAMDIFKLVGSIFVDTDEANKSLAKTDEKAGGVGKTLMKGVASAGKFALGLGTAAAAGATALMGVASNAAATADEIDKASIRMGMSAEKYQELSYAAGQCGVEMSVMEKAAKQLEGTDINMEQAMEQIMSMATAEERAAMAAELFGETVAYNMSPLIEQSQESFNGLIDRSHELGLVMSDEAVSAGVVFGDTLADVKDSFGMIVASIGTQVMPIIQKLMDWVLANMPTFKAIFGEVFVFVSEIVTIASNVIEELMPVFEKVFAYVGVLWETTLKPMLGNIVDFISNIFAGNFAGAFESLVNILENIWDGIISVIKVPLNHVIGYINSFIQGLNKIQIPDWVPGVGGVGLNIAEIPLLAKGGNVVSRGSAIVGEAGPELLELPSGARVTPLNGTGYGLGKDEIKAAFIEAFNAVDFTTLIKVIPDDRGIFNIVREQGMEYQNATGNMVWE